MTERTSVAIIGAGITGLALGYHLRRLGISHVLLESTDRVGGVIRSGRVGEHLLEWGPQRTRLTAGVRDLIDGLGIAGQLIAAPSGLPLFVYTGGRLRRVPFSMLDYLRADIVSIPSKLRTLLEPFTAGPRADESVATFFTRKVGRELYENLIGPLYGGLYASDPADMVVGLSLSHVLAEFGIGRSLILALMGRGGAIVAPPACSFHDGMEVLPRALHTANADNVWLETPVTAIQREGQRWAVGSARGAVIADRVVFTAPAPAVARLLSGVVPPAADAIGRLRYNPLAVVHLHADTDLSGLGFQVSLRERLATRGVTFNDSLFGREGVYTAYLGGATAPGVVEWSDSEIAAVASREFKLVTGFPARALNVARESMPAWDDTWAALLAVSLPPGLRLAANWQSRPGIPGRLAQARSMADELARG